MPEPTVPPAEAARSSAGTGRSDKASWGFAEGATIAPGRYVIRTLGGGSRYEVMLVWDEARLSLMVAKTLRPDQVDDEKALRELAEEADILDRLSHPVIVRGFDAVLDGPHPHLLIEHLEGPTLRALIKKGGPLPLVQVLPLAAHVAAALHYMAGAGWVHLDVKPDNIVMGVPPRLIDLSVAHTIERAERLRGAVGTDPYMAPEQCDPRNHPDRVGPHTDVFGLGATLHHAVSGRRPFPRDTGARDSDDVIVRFPQLVNDPEPIAKDVPAPLVELIRAMLAPRGADRPRADEVVVALEPIIATLPLKHGRRRRKTI